MAFWNNSKAKQPDIAKQIVEEVTSALGQLQLKNSALNDQAIRSRLANAISGGYDNGDTLHNVYLDYGYPEVLKFSHFWNMYRRFGVAKNVIELPVDTTWSSNPTIESGGELDREIEDLQKRLKIWHRVKGLDVRQRVGRYAGMFMRVRDGKEPSEPIEGTLNGVGSLVQMVPIYEGQLKVLTTEKNPLNDNYGLPTMYQFSSAASGDRNENSAESFNIHPDRIIIAAEGADNGDILGIPALEAVFNSLMDLRKIIGGGGEGYYKNASQSVVFKLTDATTAKDNASLLAKFNDSADDFMRNRARRSLWTPGMDAQTLSSDLANPKEFAMNAINDIAAGSKIPATIIIGQQTGRLASQEDSRAFLSTQNARRENFANEMISSILDWLMKYGVIKTAKYEIEWDDLLAMSDDEKLSNAERMGKINHAQYTSGGDIPFTGDEIREAAGHDPELIEDEGGEGIDDEDEDTGNEEIETDVEEN